MWISLDLEESRWGSVSLAHIPQDDLYLFFEARQVFLRDLPDGHNIHAHVIVNQDIAQAGDSPPGTSGY